MLLLSTGARWLSGGLGQRLTYGVAIDLDRHHRALRSVSTCEPSDWDEPHGNEACRCACGGAGECLSSRTATVFSPYPASRNYHGKCAPIAARRLLPAIEESVRRGRSRWNVLFLACHESDRYVASETAALPTVSEGSRRCLVRSLGAATRN